VSGTTDVPAAPRQRITPSPARIDRIDLLPGRPDLARCCRSSCSLAFSGMTRSGSLADLLERTFDSRSKSTKLLEQFVRVCRCVDDLKACQTAERPPGYYSRRPPSATTSWNRPRNRTCLDPQYSPPTDGQPKPGRCHTEATQTVARPVARGFGELLRRRSWDPGPTARSRVLGSGRRQSKRPSVLCTLEVCCGGPRGHDVVLCLSKET
jgi:hypothetical protein